MKVLHDEKILNAKISTNMIFNEVKELRADVKWLQEAVTELRLLVMDLAEMVSGEIDS
jgi:t-SNARE complex subunit (syntaxin)